MSELLNDVHIAFIIGAMNANSSDEDIVDLVFKCFKIQTNESIVQDIRKSLSDHSTQNSKLSVVD